MPAAKRKLDAATIEDVILHLDNVCVRPGMYFDTPTLFQAVGFVWGFKTAIFAVFGDDEILRNCRAEVVVTRGYEPPSYRIPELDKQIQDRFSEEADRAVEYVRLELEAWKRLRELTT